MTEIIEDRFKKGVGKSKFEYFIELYHGEKQQILDGLKALEELQKLKMIITEHYVEIQNLKEYIKEIGQENQKLKAEIEELKRQLQK